MTKGQKALVGGCVGLVTLTSYTVGYVAGKRKATTACIEPAQLFCKDTASDRWVPCHEKTKP